MRIETYYKTKGYDTLINKKHTHESFEIIQVFSDGGNALINDKIFPMTKGSLFLINSSEPHYTNPKNDSEYIRNKAVVSKKYMAEAINALNLTAFIEEIFNGEKSCIVLDDEGNEKIDYIFLDIYRFQQSKSDYRHGLIIIKIMELLIFISNYNYTAKVSYSQNMDKIIKFINENLFVNFTIDELCNAVHISKYYACHYFKKTTSMTIVQYITERRLFEAKKKLASTNDTILDIAMSVGFNSLSVFSRTFVKYEGNTPSEYRKIMKYQQK